MLPKEMLPDGVSISNKGVDITTNQLNVNLPKNGKVNVFYFGPGTDDPDGKKMAQGVIKAAPGDLTITVRYRDD
jgi:hypothetical protein